VPDCYLCPGAQRAGGERNPDYQGVHVFTNDFPALLPDSDAPAAGASPSPLLRAEPARGTCRVICFSPHHGRTLPLLTPSAARGVVEAWVGQDRELGERFQWVQIFENRGEAMGCSNPHPHGQVWALDAIPTEVATEERTQAAYLASHGAAMLDDYCALELRDRERVVACNRDWVAVVPFAAAWPFELMLLPRHPFQRLRELPTDAQASLAVLLQEILTCYDNLFETPFPYSMGWHGAPGNRRAPHWRLHAHLYPPLLRSATVRKFMVGFEMLGEPQRDLTPEQAAGRLRQVAGRHYGLRGAA
jgi:UDPglucose--hexose-1-phosphate uridylyltransferase